MVDLLVGWYHQGWWVLESLLAYQMVGLLAEQMVGS
jgi:hypothetical protein